VWLRGFQTGVDNPETGTERSKEEKEQKSKRAKEQKSKRAKEQKSKRAKEQKVGRHPAEPGRTGVLRIEPAGVVSTPRALIADAGERRRWLVSAKSSLS